MNQFANAKIIINFSLFTMHRTTIPEAFVFSLSYKTHLKMIQKLPLYKWGFTTLLNKSEGLS